MKPVSVIEVLMWEKRVGAASADPGVGCYAFEYDPSWKRRGIELAPLTMPLSDTRQIFIFPTLAKTTYFGLPSMLADALPDDFGNALIDAWMSTKGIDKGAVTVLGRLAYMGKRGMGALEFRPSRGSNIESSVPIEMKQLVEEVRQLVRGSFAADHETKAALANIIKVGTSAGGACAKAVIAWNPNTDEVRSGQFDTATGFEHWLLKFDGVGRDKELGTGEGYGRIEYAYSLMANAAGIRMSPCRLLEENGRAHFMTKRFDRENIRGETRKHHLQTLCAINHLDFRQRGTHAYEQLFMTVGKLGLDDEAKNQTFRRMAFNVMARNCDDHTKNFAFLLKERESWQLAPAYDVTHAYNPKGEWTYQHLMSVNGNFKTLPARISSKLLTDSVSADRKMLWRMYDRHWIIGLVLRRMQEFPCHWLRELRRIYCRFEISSCGRAAGCCSRSAIIGITKIDTFALPGPFPRYFFAQAAFALGSLAGQLCLRPVVPGL